MNRKLLITSLFLISATVISLILLPSCSKKPHEGMVVFVRVSGTIQGNKNDAASLQKYSIVSLNIGTTGSQPESLTDGFYSARSPRISSDGKRMIFSARLKKDDPWQIWEMDLAKRKALKITQVPESCTDPAYLPNGRVIFSRQSLNDNGDGGSSVVSCKADGSDLRQVTFDPYHYSSFTVLKDGRLLAVNREAENQRNESVFMVMRPDGTKNELFYSGTQGSRMNSRGVETGDGRIIFIESPEGDAPGGDLVQVNYNRPMHSHTLLSAAAGGKYLSAVPLRSGKYLVAYRKDESGNCGLYLFNPADKTLGQPLYESKDLIEDLVSACSYERGRKLPSEVDMGVKTGLLLCQDANFHGLTASSSKAALLRKIRIIGRDSSLGDVELEKDGSIYLKVKADTQFRLQMLDDKGNPAGKQCAWIYLRPNERRGCVGCHEDQELVPDNKVPQAVRHAPVSIPLHISKVVEKKVSLE